MPEFKNREEWLEAAVEKLKPFFKSYNQTVPENVSVSCGWPGGSNPLKTIGQCWDFERSKRKHYEIFISPMLDTPLDSRGVLSTLVHELIHAIVGIDKKHKKEFKDVVLRVGLVGRMTSTEASEELLSKLNPISEELGEYPHGSVLPKEKSKKERQKNIVKAHCPQCDYEIKVKKEHLEKGIPLCPVCDVEFFVEG
jgi:hypothetical protein